MDDYKASAPGCPECVALRAKIERLKAALEKYSQHKGGCLASRHPAPYHIRFPCTCGLDSIIEIEKKGG